MPLKPRAPSARRPSLSRLPTRSAARARGSPADESRRSRSSTWRKEAALRTRERFAGGLHRRGVHAAGRGHASATLERAEAILAAHSEVARAGVHASAILSNNVRLGTFQVAPF